MITLCRPAGLALLIGCLGLSAPAAVAETFHLEPKAVVELFTSQGCPSCPPADALLTELAAREDIVALAYHVDYWDYVGWRDTFGHRDFSNRQRAYAEGWGSSRIYTPQVIVNGVEPVVGSKAHEVHRALEGAALDLDVMLALEEDILTIDVEPGPEGAGEAVVWLVGFIDAAEVAIERGENEGKSILYSQVVTNRQALGMWEAGLGAHIRVPVGEVLAGAATGLAVLVQREQAGLPGPILGAALYHP